MTLSWRFGAYSDIGRSRHKNDDSAYAGPHLIVVADGMGGAAAGDLASAVAVQTLQRLDVPPPGDLLASLAGALQRANDRLAELVEEDPAVAGMGTTVTAALFDGERIGVAHLGDSRGYLWREGKLSRLTADHTWVQSLINEGRISDDEAKVHSHRSLLLKVLDGQHDHDPDLKLYDVQPGDRVVLCSDGLSGFVDSERIGRALSVGTAESVAGELTLLALEAGSTDNVTVVVADVVDDEAPAAEPLLVGAVAGPARGALSRFREWAHRDEAPDGKSLMIDPDADPAEELRYAPRAPQRFLALRRFVVFVALAAVATAVGFLAYRWSQQQYYVAAYEDRVAIYRGVQADLPGVTLHSVYLAENLQLSELPSFRRSQVLEGMPADSLGNARGIVANLRSFADACAQRASASAAASQTSLTSSGIPSTPGKSDGTSLRTPTTSASPPATTRGSAGSHSVTPAPRHTQPTRPQGSRRQATPQPSLVTGTATPAASGSGSNAPEECAGATPATSLSVTAKESPR